MKYIILLSVALSACAHKQHCTNVTAITCPRVSAKNADAYVDCTIEFDDGTDFFLKPEFAKYMYIGETVCHPQ